MTSPTASGRPLLFARVACGVLDAMVLLLIPCALVIFGTRTAVASGNVQFAVVLMAISAAVFLVGLLLRSGVALRFSPTLRLLSSAPSTSVLYAVSCALATGFIQMLPMMGFVVSMVTHSIGPFVGAVAVWLPAALWTWPRQSVSDRWESRQPAFSRST